MSNIKAVCMKGHDILARLKFFKSRSNFKVKVTRSKVMVKYERSWWEVSICEI